MRRRGGCSSEPALELVGLLDWTARIGAITTDALAHLCDCSVASARARLGVATRRDLLVRHRLLTDRAALYTITRAGLRACGQCELDPCRISAANTLHTIECVRVAAVLQRCYPNMTLLGERELRREERRLGAPLASAVVRRLGEHGPVLHRPDLVLCSSGSPRRERIAVEIELTIKAPRRLEEICRAWARSRTLTGVVYVAPPAVERALRRAIAKARADERIAVVSLDSLPLGGVSPAPIQRSIPSEP